jgi:hypothetical protein
MLAPTGSVTSLRNKDTLCRVWSEVPESSLGDELPCPNCGKTVELNPFTINADWWPVAAAWQGEAG